MNYFLGVKITSKSLRVHSATSSLSLTKISVPTSTDPHILLAGVVPGSYNNHKQKMKNNHIKLLVALHKQFNLQFFCN